MPNDHYIPQCYLRNFEAEPGRIWCYENGRYPSLMGIRKAASEANYYALSKDVHGIDSNVVDNIFKELETHSGPIIRKLIDMKRLELSNDDYCMMAFFIASLFNRTPSFEQNQIRMFESLLNHVNSLVTSNKDRFLAVARSAGIELDNEDPEEIEAARQVLMKGVRVDADQSKRMLLGLAVKTVFDGLPEVVYNKEWYLLHSDGSRVFITSDNPVVLLPPRGSRPTDSPGFLDASIFLPLSPKRALWLRNDRMPKQVIEVNRKVVDSFNKTIMIRADKQIYSNLKSADLEHAFVRIQTEKEARRSG